MLAVLAIDPGKEGAIAFLDGDSVILEVMPLIEAGDDKGKIDLAEVVRLLAHYVPLSSRVLLESAGIRPGLAAGSVAATWRHWGELHGVLAAMGALPMLKVVQPQSWSHAYPHGVTEKDPKKRYRDIKASRAKIATRLFPGIELKKNSKCAVPHEGVVDALLLADFGLRRLKEERAQLTLHDGEDCP